MPRDLYRIAKVAVRGETAERCSHTLDIRDRFRDGGSTNKYWFQQDPITHNCAAKHLLPIVAAVLAERFPKNRIGNLEGTVTMTREHAPIEQVAAVLVDELSPYLMPRRVDIYHYAKAHFRGEIFDHEGNHRSNW